MADPLTELVFRAHLFRDEFDRYLVGGYQQSVADVHGTTGRLLSGSFFWDRYTFDSDSDHSGADGSGPILSWGSTTADVTTDGGANTQTLAIISSRRADDETSQHREVTMNFSAAQTVGEWRGGIILKASQPSPLTGPDHSQNPQVRGYAVYWRLNLTAPTIDVLRYNPGGFSTLIARFTDDYGTPTHWAGFATDTTLEVDCHNVESTNVDGPVLITVKVDSVQVTFTDAGGSTPAGLSYPSGKIQDAGTLRILQGAGEGLWFLQTAMTETRTLAFSAWNQLSLTNPKVIAPNDMAAIAFLDEGTAVGSLNDSLEPDFPFTTRHVYFNLDFPMDSGHRDVVPMFNVLSSNLPRKRRIFEFRKETANETEWDAFWTFYDSHSGVQVPFNFTPVGGSAVKCHFLEDSVSGAKVRPGIYSLSFSIQELY